MQPNKVIQTQIEKNKKNLPTEINQSQSQGTQNLLLKNTEISKHKSYEIYSQYSPKNISNETTSNDSRPLNIYNKNIKSNNIHLSDLKNKETSRKKSDLIIKKTKGDCEEKKKLSLSGNEMKISKNNNNKNFGANDNLLEKEPNLIKDKEKKNSKLNEKNNINGNDMNLFNKNKEGINKNYTKKNSNYKSLNSGKGVLLSESDSFQEIESLDEEKDKNYKNLKNKEKHLINNYNSQNIQINNQNNNNNHLLKTIKTHEKKASFINRVDIELNHKFSYEDTKSNNNKKSIKTKKITKITEIKQKTKTNENKPKNKSKSKYRRCIKKI